ncbi:glycosyltransferase family 2 protein [Hydrocarboniphaga sp.]|uniref:glycosyltransferase family 2 protein n=1 Tax=Hydrocarboniphaga sp. TaxID=2033016 RepID=UPI003D0ABB51
MPKISVLMPVYNGIPYIQEAIDSVLTQEYRDLELVVSDNGSTDKTADYVRSLNDPRIRFFQQISNLGVYGNLNFLIAEARAPIAQILCADDKLLDGALARIAQFMEERPTCALSRCWTVGDLAFFGPSGPGYIQGSLPLSLNCAAAVLAYATFGNPVGNLSQAVCRPEKVIEVGGFNSEFSYAGDREGWLRVINRFGLELHNEELVFERIHPLQNRNLLNTNYESFVQINRTVELMAALVDPTDISLLKRHWIIHFLSPRTSAFVREAVRGNFQIASSMWRNLPLGISASACLTAYPLWKFRSSAATATVERLMKRINEINGSPAVSEWEA